MSQEHNKPATNGGKSPLKGLVGFLSGLVLATLIIIAVLLMINSNSKRDFKNAAEPVLTTPNTQTETLMPNGQTPNNQLTNVSDSKPNSKTASQVIERANVVDEQAAKAAGVNPNAPTTQKPTVVAGNQTPKANADTRFNEPNFDENNETVEPADEPMSEDVAPVVKRPARPAKQPETVAQAKNKPQPKPQPKPQTPVVSKKAEPKPTPEQILESGNIEKARELAKREAKQTKKGNVVLQAGSFNSRDYAESQRAKLALLGVQAQVAEANVNGKTVYRVQTPKMSSDKASATKDIMKRNGVGVYERSAN